MNATIARVAAGLMLAIALILSGCHSTSAPPKKAEAAAMSVFYDRSASTAMLNAPVYGNAVVGRVGMEVMHQQLGDTFRIVPIGSRTGDRAVDALSLTSDRRVRLPVVRQRIEARLKELMTEDRQRGGDDATAILYVLENSQPTCTPGSTVMIVSDGIENDAYSVSEDLSKGRPVHLPPASTPYLKGCSVSFIGIGMAPQIGKDGSAQTLPTDQLKALTLGWEEYLRSAGVQPTDMHFASIL